jgi:hypothetical protein
MNPCSGAEIYLYKFSTSAVGRAGFKAFYPRKEPRLNFVQKLDRFLALISNHMERGIYSPPPALNPGPSNL